jgi:hypothetical protein
MSLPSTDGLLVAPCNHAAALFAVTRWHYSRTLPVGKLVKFGVWEAERFVGVVLFAWGANKDLGTPYGLTITECCELVRVALSKHKTPVSRIVAIALRLLKKSNPGLQLVVSFADPVENHHGGIYQAGNWIYTGTTAPSFEYRLNEVRLNKRAYTGHNYGSPRLSLPEGAVKVSVPGKHRYLYPLNAKLCLNAERLRKPYPTNERARSTDSGATGDQPGGGGAMPTRALYTGDTPEAIHAT